MRDANRLYGFYDKLREVHMTKFPDLRFGQFMICVLSDMQNSGRDPFFTEEDEIIKFIENWRSDHKCIKL